MRIVMEEGNDFATILRGTKSIENEHKLNRGTIQHYWRSMLLAVQAIHQKGESGFRSLSIIIMIIIHLVIMNHDYDSFYNHLVFIDWELVAYNPSILVSVICKLFIRRVRLGIIQATPTPFIA